MVKSPSKKQHSSKAVHEIEDRHYRYLDKKLEKMKENLNRKLNMILSKLESMQEQKNTHYGGLFFRLQENAQS